MKEYGERVFWIVLDVFFWGFLEINDSGIGPCLKNELEHDESNII